MIGKLVAVRIDDEGPFMVVTGLQAGQKNRKARWSFKVTRGTASGIPEKVRELEEAHEDAVKA